MRIVIDTQGAQGSSQQRGIGRYTRSLAQAIIRNRRDHEVFLALNGSFLVTIEPIRAAFDELLPQENIRVWQSPGPLSSVDDANAWRRSSAELIREAFLASLKPDIVLVSSLFEGLGDDVVTSIGTLSCFVPTAVILFDLIPLIQRRPYLENPVVEAWYENKLDHLRRADLLLAISESSRQEGIRYLGFPTEACVNISTAADPQFQPQQIYYGREQDVRERYGLHRQFVMYTGGIDHRKNIEGLIRAYAKLPTSLRGSHQLAIVCSIQPPSRDALDNLAKKEGLKSDELVLTGFVSEEDLLTLYNLCKAFVYKVEGLAKIGIDPTGAKFKQYYTQDIHLVQDFFSRANFERVSSRKAKVVTSIAMFYDLDDPVAFARQVAAVLDDGGVWHFEQSYMPSMLRTNSYDTICHEHLEYYSLAVVWKILEKAGMQVIDVQMNSVNGGSFAVTAAKSGSPRKANGAMIEWLLEQERRMGLDTPRPFRDFEERVFRHRDDLRRLVRALTRDGKRILGYGASTKGNVLLQFCGFTPEDILAIAEVNQEKFGCFTPGTHIPIVSEQEARDMRPDFFLVLPWHFKSGILEREKDFLLKGGKMIFPFPEIEIV